MAVYTQLTDDEIRRFLAHYPLDALVSARGIVEGIDNTNYLIVTGTETKQKKYILTIFEQRIRAEELPFFMGLTGWLAHHGIPCPEPVKGLDGGLTYTLGGKPAALVHFLEGRNNPEITPLHTRQLGDMVARMHMAAKNFPMRRDNNLSLDAWRAIFATYSNRVDEIMPGLKTMMSTELDYLQSYWPRGLPSGVIHADVFPDNVFFSQASGAPFLSGVIDFYFSCNDAWIYDLLICLNAWCFDTAHRFQPERAGALLEAYARVRPLTREERAAMPLLARAAAMRFLVTRAHDWLIRVPGALVNPKDPMEYVTKLQFHQQHPVLPL